MSAARIVIYGNAGSGKTTMARAVARELDVAHLCLDDLAWTASGKRRSPAESVVDIEAFMTAHPGWVVEGCYGDLVEAALPHCTELRFLNPRMEVCVENCRRRPWDPAYCDSPEEQERLLGPLIEFVRRYESRRDEFSLTRHRAILEAFQGPKREFTSWEMP